MIGGLLLKSEILMRAAYCTFILGAITAITAFVTGQGAAEVVAGLQSVEEHFIQTHKATAKVFSVLLYILGGVSLFGLWANWNKWPSSRIISMVTIGLSVIVLFYAKQAGTSGMEIRHPEIRAEKIIYNSVIRNNNDRLN